jgi:hypothetical protein
MESTTSAADLKPLITLAWNQKTWSFTTEISIWILFVFSVLVFFLIKKWVKHNIAFKNFEIDQAELGVGSGKVRFKPNLTDKQVAYAIWVELSTRKIGLPIDLEHDVIVEVYDSWYAFFSVTRDLLKSIPVNKVQSDSTQKIVSLSIQVLNEGLRPHLTRWQARFRHWYDRELKAIENSNSSHAIDPQLLQAKFPDFDELKSDMQRVNKNLIQYRAKMHELIMKFDPSNP